MEKRTKIIIGAVVVVVGSLTALWFYNRKTSGIPAPAPAAAPVKSSVSTATVNKPVAPAPVKIAAPADSRIGKIAYATNDNTTVYADKSLKVVYKIANKNDFVGQVTGIEKIDSLDFAKTNAGNYVYVNAVYFQ